MSLCRLLAVNESRKSGLILCKPFHAEFAGPGAAICSAAESSYSAIVALGSPEIIEVVTYQERQRAYSRRIQWIRWLARISDRKDPYERAEQLLSSFEAFFAPQMVASIPDEVLADLVGVFPPTIRAVRAQHKHLNRVADTHNLVRVLDPKTLSVFNTVANSALPSPKVMTAMANVPCFV